ncbi:MAG: hypothetical protein MZW92_67595 [Comamonadaceae bacterium]|nr:hypothetical protein [Comamonadaceae bacterium]
MVRGFGPEEGFVPELGLLPADSNLSQLRKDSADIIVDVGASNFERMLEAIRRADAILIPVVPGQADVWSTSAT